MKRPIILQVSGTIRRVCLVRMCFSRMTPSFVTSGTPPCSCSMIIRGRCVLFRSLVVTSETKNDPMENYTCKFTVYFPVALRPNAGHGFIILEIFRSQTMTHRNQQDSSGRVISSSHRHLPDNT